MVIHKYRRTFCVSSKRSFSSYSNRLNNQKTGKNQPSQKNRIVFAHVSLCPLPGSRASKNRTIADFILLNMVSVTRTFSDELQSLLKALTNNLCRDLRFVDELNKDIADAFEHKIAVLNESLSASKTANFPATLQRLTETCKDYYALQLEKLAVLRQDEQLLNAHIKRLTQVIKDTGRKLGEDKPTKEEYFELTGIAKPKK